MWHKSARPLALAASVLAYGVANKAAIYPDRENSEQHFETFAGLEAKKKKARQMIERQMVNHPIVYTAQIAVVLIRRGSKHYYI